MVPPMFEDDEFDFGGDEPEDPKPLGGAAKRSFGDLEDDDEELFHTKKMYGATLTGGVDHATTTIINLRASLEERDSKISSLQAQLDQANLELERWKKAFQRDSILPSGTIAEPEVVLQVLQKSQASEGQLKDQILNAKRREGAMLVKLANKEQQIVQLKSMVHDLKLMMKPPAVQARRLLLDPAIHSEFTRMKKELESAEKKIKELQDDLGAVQFTPHSKNGKMLMAKCRTLQEENEEIGREASEGKIHELGTKLAMQKSFNTELKRGYQELYEYVEEIMEEAEQSHELVNILQRQLQRKEQMLQELQRQLDSANNHKVADHENGLVENADCEKMEQKPEVSEQEEPVSKNDLDNDPDD